MKDYKMKDYKMKVTPEQSRAVQEACFANGIVWKSKHNKVLNLDEPYLIIRGCFITYIPDKEGFAESDCQYIEPEAFIAMLNNKPKGHSHAELMAQYAEDAAETETPWERWEYYSPVLSQWVACVDHPRWNNEGAYRRKPDSIKVGKHEFPRPMQTAPAGGTVYWNVAFVDGKFEAYCMTWTSHAFDHNNLKAGLCHPTKEAAEQHAAVLNAINRGDV